MPGPRSLKRKFCCVSRKRRLVFEIASSERYWAASNKIIDYWQSLVRPDGKYVCRVCRFNPIG